MDTNRKKPSPGDKVLLTEVPSGLLDGLPIEDQMAISMIVGKPIVLVRYDEDGRAELSFTDDDGAEHSIFVAPIFVKAV